MTANINPKTGIPYGIISSIELDPDLVDELLYRHGTDLDYEEAKKELIAQFRADPINLMSDYYPGWSIHKTVSELIAGDLIEVKFLPDNKFEVTIIDSVEDDNILDYLNFNDNYTNDESTVEGVYQNVHYRSTWIGGALNFFILFSPHITDKANICSPCVPNAGNLDELNGDYTCYNVPDEWRAVE